MKPRFISALVLSVLTFCLNVSAQTVSPEAARAKATDFFSTGARNLPAKKGVKRQAPAVDNIELAYTSEKDGKTCFYVFNNGDDGGFVIVGGDEAAKEILVFSDHGHFNYDEAPDNFKNMLEQYAEQISLAKPVEQKRMAKAPATNVQKEDIADLIETTWDQWDPYNRAIPQLVNSYTGEEFAPPTGCVQTAVAQVMKYWNYPEHGVGHETKVLDYSQINAYDPGAANYTPEFGTMVHNVDFASTTYDWGNMLNNYTGEKTEKQINAVSTLMYHAGVACNAVWGVYETTGASPAEGLQKFFDYSPKAEEIERDEYDDETWEELIYGELKQDRPVLYSGVGDGYVSHQYIVHGYSSEYDMYKVNWGWGGTMDCYCKLTPVSGSTLLGYENHQTAVIRLQPATMDNTSFLDYGDTFWCDGFKYKVISSTYNTVELIKPDENEQQYSEPTITIPSKVNYGGLDYSVIAIGKNAFHRWVSPGVYLPSITEMSLPDNLRIIRALAFAGCDIKTISIPNSVSYMDQACLSSTQIEEIELPNSLKSIPGQCFAYCYSLKSVNIPEGVTSIGAYAFENCTNLAILELPASLTSLEWGVFRGCNNLEILTCHSETPPLCSEIEYPFSETTNTGYLFVPETSIDSYKNSTYWQDWKNIKPIESTDIPSLGKIVTFDNIEYKLIPTGAEISNVLIDGSELTIPDYIFVNGAEWKVVSVGSHAFEYKSFDKVVLPQYLSTIKSEAFSGCYAKQIVIPKSVTIIGTYAFAYCYYLERIILPSSVESIPSGCFAYCRNLYEVELPSSLKNVDSDAFTGCENLFTIICNSEETPLWNNYSPKFSNYVEGTVYVPSGSVQKYRSSNYWKDWRFIEPIESYNETHEPTIIVKDRLSYRLLDHGAIVLTPKYNINDDNLVIPETIEYENKEYEVISIGINAFSNRYFSSVHLPSSIHSIMAGAFADCSELVDINLCDNITYIGVRAFERCYNLQSIHIPASLKTIYDSFQLSSIEKMIIPEGVETINTNSFNIKGLKEMVIPSSLKNWSVYLNGIEVAYLLNPDNITIYDAEGATVYVPNEFVDKCKMIWDAKEVLPISPLTSIVLNENNVVITLGETKTIAADFSPADASLKYMKWTSSDPTVASVDADGVVTAHKPGSVTITATSMYYPDVAASCTVIVSSNAGDANGDGNYPRTITFGLSDYATYCTDANLDFSEVEGVKAYIASSFNLSTGSLTITRVDNVPAGEGFLLKGTAGESYEIPVTDETSIVANLFKGTTTATTIYPTDDDKTNYVQTENSEDQMGFYRFTGSVAMPANKAWLQIPTNALGTGGASNIRGFVISEDGELLTSIVEVEQETKTVSNTYDLQGRRLGTQPAHGLYIQNGKKVAK